MTESRTARCNLTRKLLSIPQHESFDLLTCSSDQTPNPESTDSVLISRNGKHLTFREHSLIMTRRKRKS